MQTSKLAVAVLGALFALGAQAGDVVVIKKAGPALDDMKVTRDKETGRLRPATPEEIQEMSRGSGSGASDVVVLSRPVTTIVKRPDGSAAVLRSIDDMDSIVATRAPDGKIVLRHVNKHSPAASHAHGAPKE